MDSDDQYYMFDDRWFHVICYLDLSCTWCHTGAYFPFRMRFTDLHGGYMCDDRWFHDICSSNLSCIRCHTGAYFPFQMWFMVLRLCRVFDDKWFHVTRFLTCRASDAHIRAYFPFQMWFMVLHLCRMFDDRWFHVARFLICHTFDAILRHITVLDEIYRSWRSCAFIPIYETYIETMIYLLSLRWFPRWSLSGVTQLGLHFLTLRCHPAFLPGGAPLIRGPDSIIDIDDLSSSDFSICRVLMPHWGIFPISAEICRSPTDWHDRP